MKRSEAQNHIRRIIDIYHNRYDKLIISPNRMANMILQELEELGMLPPPKYLEAVSGRIAYYYVHDSIEAEDYLVGLVDDYLVDLRNDAHIPNTSILWEPEDE